MFKLYFFVDIDLLAKINKLSLILTFLINIHYLIKLSVHINHLLIDAHSVRCFVDVHFTAEVSLVCILFWDIRVNLLEE